MGTKALLYDLRGGTVHDFCARINGISIVTFIEFQGYLGP